MTFRRCLLAFFLSPLALLAAPPGQFRKPGQPVKPVSDTLIVAEAEEFHVERPGWQARPWGENYFAATFANSFLSRKAFLGAPEQCDRSVATIEVEVPKAGRYLALIRYEAVHRFETQFKLLVEQNGQKKLDRLYGARDNVKIWAFKEGLKKEVAWPWGAVENVVWEGHDAAVDLAAGKAKLSLIADQQKGNAAKRNVDLVMLTSDTQDVQNRIKSEGYLPLDGMLTQEGDVYLRLHNAKEGADMALTIPNCTEHSPYWVHMRKWKPRTVNAKTGESTDWVEVGSLLDSLNDGQWTLNATTTGTVKKAELRFGVEFGVRNAAGGIDSIAHFKNLRGPLALAYDADTRYTRRIRLADDVVNDLVKYLKTQPVAGKPPSRTLIYGGTFDPRKGDAQYSAAIDEFIRLMGATALNRQDRTTVSRDGALVKGYVDLRGQNPAQLEKFCETLKKDGLADRVAVVSLGDEIGLAAPGGNVDAGFRAWLQSQKLKPADVDPAASNWEQVKYTPKSAIPSLLYYSKLYSHRYGIGELKKLTDVLRKHLPNAGIGANFSPHHKNLYMGETYHWISTFREDGMTMPWGEDYIWQVPVGSQQMNFLMVDMYRCGIKNRPGAKIHYYVMPHTPGNTTGSWRRQFFGDIGHGVKVFNLFEFRPVQAAYTENHCSDPAMYQEVRRGIHELGTFEDIVQDGSVRHAQAGLWFSEAADVWDDYQHSLGAGKRSLYIAIRHQQQPLDCILDGDDLSGLKVLYLTDRHVTRAGSKAIADWVNKGGRLFSTAGAGMFDELNQPNRVLRELLGVEETALDHAKEDVTREKEHLPFAEAMDTITLKTNAAEVKMPVIGAKGRFRPGKDAVVVATFADGTPAVVQRTVGKGRVDHTGALPGLTYFKPAIPLRPVDRGSTDDSMAHFIPTKFDRVAAMLVATAAEEAEKPVLCSEPLVESNVIQAKSGTVVTLVNWSGGPVKGLKVTLAIDVPFRTAALATGKAIEGKKEAGKTTFTLDIDVAEALVLRP